MHGGRSLTSALTLLTLFARSCLPTQATVSVGDDSKINKGTILVFGGNGFMGAETVLKLVEVGYSVTIANRGSWYWDSQRRIQQHVKRFIYNRRQPISDFPEFDQYVAQTTFRAVVDFSAYHPYYLQQALSALRRRVGLYVYISSDSIYEVCLKDHMRPSLETDDKRPTDPGERQRLAEADDYGHRKMECEEELQSQRNDDGPPYLFLRLPDVIGPRDNTHRWWFYQIWIKLAQKIKKPVTLPSFLSTKNLSFVYALDVATLISTVLESPDSYIDQIFNLALSESIALPIFLNNMASAMNMTIQSHVTENNSIMLFPTNTATDDGIDSGGNSPTGSFYLFPSVTKGPMNTTKAEHHLPWHPTKWTDVIRQTVSFYDSAMTNPDFLAQRNEILHWVQTKLLPGDPETFYRIVEEVYPARPQRDEL